MKPRILVVGGGFKGIVAAKYLTQKGAQVTLAEQGKRLGGIHFSIPWNGFELDLGCHVFSNEDDNTNKLLFELLGEEPIGMNPVVKSVYQGIESHGIEYPDFSNLPEADISRCLFDLLNHASSNQDTVLKEPSIEETLDVFLRNRYGKETASLLNAPLQKMLLEKPEKLSSIAFSALPARRVSLVKSHIAAFLKTQRVLNELILQSSAEDPMKYTRGKVSNFKKRCFYPATGGMGGFARAATSHLRSLGVKILIETSIHHISQDTTNKLAVEFSNKEIIEYDKIFWTSNTSSLSETLNTDIDFSDTIHSIPMVLYYYDINRKDVGPYAWVQNFNHSDLIYRASAPSTYGRATAPDGRAYALAEVIVSQDSELYLSPDLYVERVWNELINLGVANDKPPSDHKIVKTPVSYKFPKPSFAQAKGALDTELTNYSNVHLLDEWIFGKAASVKEIVTLLDRHF